MENETVDEKHAKQWLLARTIPWNIDLDGVAKLVSTYAESECSRLASRVEELENLIAKHSGCSHCNDSASGVTSANSSSEIRKCAALDLPEGFLGQRCQKCDSLFANSNFKFCSECGAQLCYAMEDK